LSRGGWCLEFDNVADFLANGPRRAGFVVGLRAFLNQFFGPFKSLLLLIFF
jgi:hypothetical protein